MSESQPELNNNIPCKYCGRMIPAEATFCYYCARELIARPERPAGLEIKDSRVWLWVIGLLVVAAIIGFVLLRYF